MQAWPLLVKPPPSRAGRRRRDRHRPGDCGDLPPSSSVTRLKVSAAGAQDRLPTAGGAGEGDLGDIGMGAELRAHDVSPRPVTILNTPGGNPASCRLRAMTWVWIALISLGLTTVVQPAAIAVASLRQMKPSVLFHGVMAADHAERLHHDFGAADRAAEGIVSTVFAMPRTERRRAAPENPVKRETGAPYSSTIAANMSSAGAATASCRRLQHRDALGLAWCATTPGRRAWRRRLRGRASSASPRRTSPICFSVAGLKTAHEFVAVRRDESAVDIDRVDDAHGAAPFHHCGTEICARRH